MTNSRGGDPDRFRDVTIGHGSTRKDALADALRQARGQVEVLAQCEIAGTGTVLVRPATDRSPGGRPVWVYA